MAKYRQDRLNEELRHAAAEIFRTIRDPRVRDALVSVTGAEVTPDLKYARIYYSVLEGDGGRPEEVDQGVAAASGYVRSRLAETLNLRITPELTFVRDRSISHGARIERIIRGFSYESEQPDGGDGSDHERDDG